MRYLKTFEKVIRTFNIGDEAIWIHKDFTSNSRKFKVNPLTKDIEYGDNCIVIDVKGIKGKLYVRLENLKNNRIVNTFLTEGKLRIKPYNQYGSWFESICITKKENFTWDIFSAIHVNNIKIVEKLINNKKIINSKNDLNRTPLVFSAFCENIKIIKILLDNNANCHILDKFNNHFIDYLDYNDKIIIEKEYPKIYNEYLIIKQTEKFNL